MTPYGVIGWETVKQRVNQIQEFCGSVAGTVLLALEIVLA